MKKKLVSVLLAGTMVLSSLGMSAMAKSSDAAPDWDDCMRRKMS